MEQVTYYCSQDGADFYVYLTPPVEGGELTLTRTYPYGVKDFDMEAAERARKWFLRLVSSRARVVWLNIMGEAA